ncbi:MAG: OmpA family protein [Bacteroidia bacterium]|nr:OmpA family protein [Bacteroidia bacterium]
MAWLYMIHALRILTFILLVTSCAMAQHYTRGAARLGILGGVNIGGEEATLKYAQYTLHPYGMATGQYYPVHRIALSASLYAGTLAAEFSGRALFPGYGRQQITEYDTKYYGVSAGGDWMVYSFGDFTPFTRFRLGTMMHHTRVIGTGGFERRLSKGALIYQFGGGIEYSLNREVKLTFGFDLTLSNSDEIDGLASGGKNDALSVFSLGLVFLLRPGEREAVPATRPRPVRPRTTTTGPVAATQRSDTAQTPVAQPADDDWGPGTSPAWYDGTYEPARDAVALEQTPIHAEALIPVEEGAKLQLVTSLALTPLRRFADLEEDPSLFTFTARQNGREAMQLRNYIEILRDNAVIYQGSSELRLSGRERTFTADEFVDLPEMLLRTQGDETLVRGNYVVRISTVAWDHELSSISQAKFLNIDLRPIFGASADTAKSIISTKAIDASAEGEDALLVNFFDPPQRVGVAVSGDTDNSREAFRITPATIGSAAMEERIASDIDRSAGEALRLRGLAANNRDAARLRVILAEVYFPLNDDRITEEARLILDNVARHLNQHPELSIEVRGYANDQGDAPWNTNLAHRRAQRVVEYLVRRKSNSWRLGTRESEGFLAPIRPGEDARTARKAEIVLITK